MMQQQHHTGSCMIPVHCQCGRPTCPSQAPIWLQHQASCQAASLAAATRCDRHYDSLALLSCIASDTNYEPTLSRATPTQVFPNAWQGRAVTTVTVTDTDTVTYSDTSPD